MTCSSSDASGNRTGGSFAVHVKGALEQLDDLVTAVVGIGPGTSLADKVDRAKTALAGGDEDTACEILAAFAHQVDAQTGVSISASIATELLATTSRIEAVLTC